jgi:hypothetical protein
MRHVNIAELASGDIGAFEAEHPASVDSLSRELALAAASGDRRVSLLSAMQMLGNIRDFLVAPQSPEAEQLVDEAIQALMRCERELPADWRPA